MDISRQVFRRSIRMGVGYVILSLIMGVVLTLGFGLAGSLGNVVSAGGRTVNLGDLLGSIVIPLGALFGLIITIPVYLLFVYDKNAGVLEYLLAVGMSQRDIFKGYLKAAWALSLVAMVPMVLLNLAVSQGRLTSASIGGGLSLATGIAVVALTTVLMTAFSSMQRRPSGMNSPLGISIGIVFVIPELILVSFLGTAILWFDAAIAAAVLVTALILLLSLDRLILREKLLP